MSELLSNKTPSLQAAVEQLVCAIGPERAAVRDDFCDDPERVTVFSRADPVRSVVVSVSGVRERHYSVTYDESHTKPGGVRTTSAEVLFEGMVWITRKVIKDGLVNGEFEEPSESTKKGLLRRRRELKRDHP
jgi:hypothetical protein